MKFYGDEQLTTIKKRRLEYLRCDYCKKKIVEHDNYYKVTTGHHDWGNDSIDSMKDFEICDECISKFTNEFLTNKPKYESEFIHIDRTIFFKSPHHDFSYYNENSDLLVENDELERG